MQIKNKRLKKNQARKQQQKKAMINLCEQRAKFA